MNDRYGGQASGIGQYRQQTQRSDPPSVRSFLTERIRSTTSKIDTLETALAEAKADLADATRALEALGT